MNYTKTSKLAAVAMAASLGVGASAAVLDTFLTYTGGAPGINLSKTGTGFVNESPETIPFGTDTDFANLSRRATLTVAAGTATSSLNNNAIAGKLSWGNNPGNAGSALIRYDFPVGSYATGSDFASLGYNQLEVDFSSADLVGQIDVTMVSHFGAITTTVSQVVNNATATLVFPSSSFAGIWNNVRRISFVMSSPNTDGADYVIQEIRLVNNQVPEAKTVVPTIAFAAGIGFMAWRRRSSK